MNISPSKRTVRAARAGVRWVLGVRFRIKCHYIYNYTNFTSVSIDVCGPCGQHHFTLSNCAQAIVVKEIQLLGSHGFTVRSLIDDGKVQVKIKSLVPKEALTVCKNRTYDSALKGLASSCNAAGRACALPWRVENDDAKIDKRAPDPDVSRAGTDIPNSGCPVV